MTTYKWPDSLKLGFKAKQALEKIPQDHPVLGAWPEDEKFKVSNDAKAIAAVLIPEFHKELANAKIAYVFKEKATSRGPSSAGKASKLGGVNAFLTDLDFVIVILWERWKEMELVTRVAVVDHYLERCQVDEGGTFTLVDPDLQEFNNIVSRWGPWDDRVAAFVRAAQTDMFQLESKDLGHGPEEKNTEKPVKEEEAPTEQPALVSP